MTVKRLCLGGSNEIIKIAEWQAYDKSDVPVIEQPVPEIPICLV
jgi:hypothetical protein